MNRSRSRLATGLATAFGCLVAAGCGGAIPASQGGPATVTSMQSSLGRVLVDESGHTLYLFEKDESSESYCNGACASVWPPVEIDGSLTAGAGVSRSRLGTIVRDDGERQVTYAGHPLYYYAGDASKPGKTGGEGLEQFGSEWYLVSPAGKVVESDTEESGGGNEGGGGSYGGGGSTGGGGGNTGNYGGNYGGGG
jgi:predicted lipoprotein with Yx(FWY)xxD motif